MLGISDLYLVYVDNVTEIDFRSKPLSGGSWTSEFNIASGTDFDNNFDAAVSENGLLAVAYDNLELRYREYDGSNWGPSVLLDSSESFMPQMIFINNVPFVIYTVKDSSDQMLLQYTSRKSGVFSTPEILNKSAGYFDSVFLYDLSSAAYSDLTSESQSSSTADIYHPSSSVIFKESGDILYLGIDQKFRQLYLILFTSGIGGTLVYSYWDGSNWKSFTPVNGNYNFDSAEKKLLLWTDYQSMPTDWQKRIINGTDRYWIKIETGSAFSTAPVGSQITTISDVNSFIIRR